MAAATNKAQDGTNRGQSSASETPGANEVEVTGTSGIDTEGNRYIQGVCPNGWHLPSDREWNKLEKELYNNPVDYSMYTAADLPFDSTNPTWNSIWEHGLGVGLPSYGMRGSQNTKGHGYAGLSQCARTANFGSGKSLSSEQGGFNIIPGGVS